MQEIITLQTKLKDNGTLSKEELQAIAEHNATQNSSEIQNKIDALRSIESVTIVDSSNKSGILAKFLDAQGIKVDHNSPLKLAIADYKSKDIECKEVDFVLIDGIEEMLKAPLQEPPAYTSQALKNSLCPQKSIAISTRLLGAIGDDDSKWEDKFTELDSSNPARDIKRYSNTSELISRIRIQTQKRERVLFVELQELLEDIVNKNASTEEIERVREKYREENNYKELYRQKINLLVDISGNLAQNLREISVSETMRGVSDKLLSQEFSIGVTGIIKAGKSTMLNAMLGEDILGTAIRPETANLTTIKRADNRKAIVHFWSQEEWDEIKQNAYDDQSKEFVATSESLPSFGKYISAEPKSAQISIEELDSYTSARQSDNLCNLVKEVELYVPVEFLDGGVAIVDTPGIDDPIIQRELITREYLSNSSAILHLMNAKQSATQKDIEFIGDALIDQGISSLLVVITRIDTLGSSKDEIDSKLSQIIEHAKSNLETYLSRRSNDDISSILSKLEFLPLAGKFALQHRVGDAQKALKKGYELKDTGILEIENYLDSMLFGSRNERAVLAIDNAKRTIERSILKYGDDLKNNLDLIGKEKAVIDEKLQEIKNERAEISNQLSDILNNIKQEKEKIRRGLGELKDGFESKFDGFRRDIIEDISATIIDALYNGDKPDENEIKALIESKLKEFVSELTQWYQKQAQYRLEDSLDYVDSQYATLKLPDNVDTSMKIDKVDVMGEGAQIFLMGGIGYALGYAGAFLLGPVGWIGAVFITWWAGDWLDKNRLEKIEKEVAKKMKTADRELQKTLKTIHENMNKELEKYDESLIAYFQEVAVKPANDLQNIMKEKEKILKELSENSSSRAKSDAELKGSITSQLEAIDINFNKLQEV